MDHLPADIIFCISDCLDVNTVRNGLCFVNRRFHALLNNNNNYWRQRLRKNNVELPTRHFSNGSQRDAHFALKFESELQKLTIKEPAFKQAHYGTVDAIRVLNNGQYCATAARNYSLSFWSLNNEINRLHEVKQAHLGWIWSIDEGINGNVLTSGFDHFLREWTFTDNGVNMANEVCVNAPVLFSRSAHDLIYVGACNTKITVFDRRDWSNDVCKLSFHKQPVIDAVVEGSLPYLYTLSENELVCADSRMWAKFKVFRWKDPCYSIAKCHEILYAACTTENRQNSIINLIDTKTLTVLNEITIENSPKCRLSAGEATFACLGSDLKVLSGGIKPKQLWSYSGISDAVSLDYKHGRLAVTTINGQLFCF